MFKQVQVLTAMLNFIFLGDKSFTVLPSTSGYPSNDADNKYAAGNADQTNALAKNFSGMSVSGMEVIISDICRRF